MSRFDPPYIRQSERYGRFRADHGPRGRRITLGSGGHGQIAAGSGLRSVHPVARTAPLMRDGEYDDALVADEVGDVVREPWNRHTSHLEVIGNELDEASGSRPARDRFHCTVDRSKECESQAPALILVPPIADLFLPRVSAGSGTSGTASRGRPPCAIGPRMTVLYATGWVEPDADLAEPLPGVTVVPLSGRSRADLTRTWKRERGASGRLVTLLPGTLWWAILDSNQRPLPCEGSALAI